MNMETLEKRIAAALTEDTPSSVLAALLDETEGAIEEANQIARRERKKGLDVVACTDVRSARDRFADAELRRDRLRAAFPRLQARHDKVAAEEHHVQWLAKYEAAR